MNYHIWDVEARVWWISEQQTRSCLDRRIIKRNGIENGININKNACVFVRPGVGWKVNQTTSLLRFQHTTRLVIILHDFGIRQTHAHARVANKNENRMELLDESAWGSGGNGEMEVDWKMKNRRWTSDNGDVSANADLTEKGTPRI